MNIELNLPGQMHNNLLLPNAASLKLTAQSHKIVPTDSGSGANFLCHLAISNTNGTDSKEASMSNQSVVNLSISTLDKNFVEVRSTRNTNRVALKRMYRRSYETINKTNTIKVRPYKSMPCVLQDNREKIAKVKVNTTINKSIIEAKPKQISKLPKLLGPDDIRNISRIQAFIRGYLTRKRIEEKESKFLLKKQVIDCQIDYELAEQLKYYDAINPKLKIKEYIKMSKSIIDLRNKYITNNSFIWNDRVRTIFLMLFKLVQKCDTGVFITKDELHYFIIHVLNLPIQESRVDNIIDSGIHRSKNGLYSFKSIMTWYIMKREDGYSLLGYIQRHRRNSKQKSLSFTFDEEYISKFFNYNLRNTLEKQIYLGCKPNYNFLLHCHRCGIHFTKCIQYAKHIKETHGYYC